MDSEDSPEIAALRAVRRRHDRHEAKGREIRAELDAAIAAALKADEKVSLVDAISPFSPRYTLEIARKAGIPPRKKRPAAE
jgi:hypothetical protein